MQKYLGILLSPLLVTACSDSDSPVPFSSETAAISSIESLLATSADYNTERNAYFGDLHVHTMYSYDAFIFDTTASPEDAYKFAKGATLIHAAGFDIKLTVPLDFYAVTDHAYYLGIMREMAYGDSLVSQHEVAQGMDSLDNDVVNRRSVFAKSRDFSRSDRRMEIMDLDVVKSTWQDIVETVNRRNEPGKFTAFVGYEYMSSGSEYENLHRNVIFRDGEVPDIPFLDLTRLIPKTCGSGWAIIAPRV